MNIDHIVIVDRMPSLVAEQPGRLIIRAQDYIRNNFTPSDDTKRIIRVVNLCQPYGYLKSGYYCSLLADARGHRCVPSISDVVHANWKRIYRAGLTELNESLNKHYPAGALNRADAIAIYFGRTSREELDRFARKVFDAFRLPAMQVDIRYSRGRWHIEEVRPMPMSEIEDREFFNEALSQYTGSYWQKRDKETKDKFWLAILHNPDDPLSPSDPKALKKFISVGRKMDIFVELITKRDADSLLEFDALFIRETTRANDHTYRFAQKAEAEGIPVIDDPTSILRCCNKIYLQELLNGKHIRTPHGAFLHHRQKDLAVPEGMDFPLVVKVPDGSFSQGVFKVSTDEEFQTQLQDLFKKTELVLVQEFIQSDYDWRILILGGKAIVACKYFMARNHWQIYNHASSNSRYKEGDWECVAIEKAPQKVVKTALKAAKLIGDGLYGVDLKETPQGVFVIEVNDNPNIDSGVEDKILGDQLYQMILEHFTKMIEG